MRHPSEHQLALHAGDDLRGWQQWWVTRHLSRCESCQQRQAEFQADRQMIEWAAGDLPAHVDWDRLAREMTANIRVGLEAGACITPAARRTRLSPQNPFSWRSAAAVAGLTAVVLTGWYLDRPGRWTHPPPSITQGKPNPAGIQLHATRSGVEMMQNGRGLTLLPQDREATPVVRSEPDSIRARYVDTDTGQVTIYHVYAD